jgi:hypothetical protein
MMKGGENMSRIEGLIEYYYDLCGYYSIDKIADEMFEDGEIDEEQCEQLKEDDDAIFFLKMLQSHRPSEYDEEWALEMYHLSKYN